MSRRRPKRSSATVGALALLVLGVLTYLGFAKDLPFTRGFRVQAEFASANGLRAGSPVRIAGVDVGEVQAVAAREGTDGALVTLELEEAGRPVHQDATAKIRPRIFLEGNFFVDLTPGTPGAPVLDDGDTIKVTQTATPVQLDQVLGVLQSDARADLQDLLDALGTGLDAKPTRAEDADAHPSTRGETAGESLNDAYADAGPALRATAQVNDALLGEAPGDLRRLLRGTARVTGALTRDERALGEWVGNFNRAMAAFGDQEAEVRATVRELAPTLETANRALAALDGSLPATRAWTREILPGIRETRATLGVAFPWIEQARGLVAREELGGLARDLSPATADLAGLVDEGLELLPEADRAARCATEVLLPTGDVVIRDEFTTGAENYKEFFYALVGLAGEGQNFDGNGSYVRFQTGGGAATVALGSPADPVLGNTVVPPLGVRPRFPARRPPYRPGVPCHTQARPDLNGPAGASGPPDRAVTPQGSRP